MNQPFSWNEAAKEALHEAYKRGHKCAAAGYVSKDDENHAVAEALQSLNQAFKQAVDSAKPKKKRRSKDLEKDAKYWAIGHINGFNQATDLYQANLHKFIGGGR